MKTTTKEPKYLPLLVTPLEHERLFVHLLSEVADENVAALSEMLHRANARAQALEDLQGTVLTDAAVNVDLEDELASEVLGH